MLTNQVALVTGGGKGIGKAISVELSKAGADIAIIYASDEQTAKETAEEITALGRTARIYKCDVSSFEESKKTVDEVLKDFGRCDILVNNAGITKDALILGMKEVDFDKVIGINLKGAFNFIKHLYPKFVSKRSGRIINISSVSGIDGNAGQANYSASKAGLIGLSKSVSKELASRGVTCNVIAPGFIETAMTDVLKDEQKKAIIDRIPLKRRGTATEGAAMAVFLAGSGGSYITGQLILIDVGLSF